jgi:hypothetical protein
MDSVTMIAQSRMKHGPDRINFGVDRYFYVVSLKQTKRVFSDLYSRDESLFSCTVLLVHLGFAL